MRSTLPPLAAVIPANQPCPDPRGFPFTPDPTLALLTDGEPIVLQHSPQNPKPKGIILCLHGFTATPYGVGPIARACWAAGFDAIAPLLPGHGLADPRQQRQAMAQLTPQGLLNQIRAQIQWARDHYDVVGLYGDSMGGAIALRLASEGSIDACTVTAPALKLPFRAAVLCRYFGWLNVSLPKRVQRRFYTPCYDFENSRAGRTLWELSQQACQSLPKLTCPTFVAHSHADRTISPIVPDWIRDRAAGPVTVEWFDRSGHLLPLDVEGADVAASIAEFFQTHLN